MQGEPLYAFPLGQGKKKVMMWSQMHGNESTTTKALWDLVNFLLSGADLAQTLMAQCRLMIVPMLNPDGALAYTRENANGVDLNRDAQDLTQPESRAIRQLFDRFLPDHCFNLHDQRTLFGAGASGRPATISFLSPACDASRKLGPNRKVAMQIIAAMDARLQTIIPGQVGRFDDSFNANCIGDTFQMAGVPTLLFEAGHQGSDYQREDSREFMFQALLAALETIALDGHQAFSVEDYFRIPENEKRFYDIILLRPESVDPKLEGRKVGIRYREELRSGKIEFVPEVVAIGALEGHFAHLELETLDSKDFGPESVREDIVKLIQEFEN